MSASEEDIQASGMMTAFKPASHQYDSAHYFRHRTVLQVSGDIDGLEKIATGPAPGEGQRGRFISLLTSEGHLDADLYIAPFGDSYLIDVHTELVEHVMSRLSALEGVGNVDPSAADRWRIFGELPDQKGAETSFETIRFGDSRRRELGNRVFRDAAEPEGFEWRHARKWDGHAMRLGLLPDHRCIIGKRIRPEEAGYHKLLGGTEAEAGHPERRILPVRIDVCKSSIPVMVNAPLMAEGEEVGTMLDQEGVCGIALVSLEPWREMLAVGARLTCLDVPVLMSWPTWLASESEGRFGPAAGLI